jgi:hypothetical protein
MSFRFLQRIPARRWHTWLGVILALPILVVALTAVFMAHRKVLGTDQVNVAAWLPGYHRQGGAGERPDVRSTFIDRGGRVWLGTQEGLFAVQGGQVKRVASLGLTPVRAFAESDSTLMVAARNGVWQRDGERWSRVLQGEAWSLVVLADGRFLAVMRDQAPQWSRDGKLWRPDPAIGQALDALSRRPADGAITLSRLIRDLHTGEALLGKKWEWVWIDVLGVALATLALTGLWMWRLTQKRKAQLAGALT